MSDTLTDAAPVEDAAVAPVGDPAPVANSEVDGGSGNDGIPVARFNGLMSSFNKVQAEKADLERQLSELRSELETKPTQETPKPVSDDVLAVVNQLREDLAAERLKSARKDVLDEFPEAKPFADLIVADSQEDLREMAKVIAERVRGINAPAPTADPVEVTTPVVGTEPVAPVDTPAEAPVTGGATVVQGNPNSEDKVLDAIKNRSFGQYLQAKYEQLGPEVLEQAG